jgi:hypothetical protein
VKEVEQLAALFGMDCDNISEYEPEARTTYLEVMKNKLITAQVISSYILVDERDISSPMAYETV